MRADHSITFTSDYKANPSALWQVGDVPAVSLRRVKETSGWTRSLWTYTRIKMTRESPQNKNSNQFFPIKKKPPDRGRNLRVVGRLQKINLPNWNVSERSMRLNAHNCSRHVIPSLFFPFLSSVWFTLELVCPILSLNPHATRERPDRAHAPTAKIERNLKKPRKKRMIQEAVVTDKFRVFLFSWQSHEIAWGVLNIIELRREIKVVNTLYYGMPGILVTGTVIHY